ncbi:cdc42 effector protein 2 isoform X1 [Syngnathus scovelli]|uniref:cdc42 effector protein 2 isoform X1 n=2 Tax=Syngnathus scovelli TaxID=161590 RepID=UPI00211012C0|nr:cdc42 effector protein 2 isoform X1 [Syngnathus scovelli]
MKGKRMVLEPRITLFQNTTKRSPRGLCAVLGVEESSWTVCVPSWWCLRLLRSTPEWSEVSGGGGQLPRRMPAKTPIYLKTTTPKRGKKPKLRDVLSGDMISPPLGDVRHSAHVGPQGEQDMFGDVGFLRGKMDMLPARNGDTRSHSVDGRHGDEAAASDYSYNGFHYQHSSSGLLKTTISMPVFIAHEQAPPKPPRLHLDDVKQRHLQPADGPDKQQGQRSSKNGGLDISLSPSLHRLVPSSGSFSEVSSEESGSDGCGPPDERRGLSLDSYTSLSNEDLRSDSPCGLFLRSDSVAGLNLDLDLGPSILDDVLRIMDRYKDVDHRCEL